MDLVQCSKCGENIQDGLAGRPCLCSHLFHPDCLTATFEEEGICPIDQLSFQRVQFLESAKGPSIIELTIPNESNNFAPYFERERDLSSLTADVWMVKLFEMQERMQDILSEIIAIPVRSLTQLSHYFKENPAKVLSLLRDVRLLMNFKQFLRTDGGESGFYGRLQEDMQLKYGPIVNSFEDIVTLIYTIHKNLRLRLPEPTNFLDDIGGELGKCVELAQSSILFLMATSN
ncbi:unnamed protein product [Hymenolepis diminuta]|nr:unnamed protein product [Hymenolepis diminuta]